MQPRETHKGRLLAGFSSCALSQPGPDRTRLDSKWGGAHASESRRRQSHYLPTQWLRRSTIHVFFGNRTPATNHFWGQVRGQHPSERSYFCILYQILRYPIRVTPPPPKTKNPSLNWLGFFLPACTGFYGLECKRRAAKLKAAPHLYS